MTIERHELSANIGIEITGMTGHQLVDPAVAADCQAALDRYGVVVYREVHVDDDDLLAFSRLLGEVVVPRVNEGGAHPEIARITMDPAESVLASYRQGNFLWHIDGSIDDLPQKGTLLTAIEVDPAGGDTQFASTYAAYEALPEDDKAEIAELSAVHSFGTAQRQANPDPTAKELAGWAKLPTRVHPLVWSRADGRKSLLIGCTTDEIVGWPADRSKALLDRLLAWSTQPQFTLRHHWRKGDLVVWDNTGMLHRALPFEPTSRRMLHRTTLVGEELVSAG